MPKLFTLETPDWLLTVWSHDILRAQNVLKKTLASKGKALPNTCLRFNPRLYLGNNDSYTEMYSLQEPVFFENKLYEFDFQFQESREIHNTQIKHRLKSIEEVFHSTGLSLRGSINFANHIGWFKLELCYQTIENEKVSQIISFEVLPTKLDLAEDIASIHQVIDDQYPLLRFSFAQKTEQELAQSKKSHERFSLLWLAHFQRLRKELEVGVRHILHAPHSRLLSSTKTLRAEQLKGRLAPRLQERIQQNLSHHDFHTKYAVSSKMLSRDTPENRFIKMVLIRCSRELSVFLQRAKKHNAEFEHEVLSDNFFTELDQWKKPLERYLQQPFFREIGHYEGLTKESLVLHQKQGYANVYRIWQQLKLYLDVFGKQASLSMKSVAELYEIWCVLEVRRVLVDVLGFIEVHSRKAALHSNTLEKQLRNGMGAAFYLQRGDVSICLAHEPVFRSSSNPQVGKIYSWTTSQKPDILLEVEFSNGEKIRWIFDAKYRIFSVRDGMDLAPDDAINQMHRYRDSLIYIHKNTNGWSSKQRPIFGAFVLYPGSFTSDCKENPYADAIKEVGIGAFPLLPNSENTWLQDFLIEQLGSATCYSTNTADFLSVQEAPRIAYTGLESMRYRDLTLAVALGGRRDEVYKDGYRRGTANWYHIPHQTIINKKMQATVMHEIRYCAFVVHNKGEDQRRIEFIYPINSVCLIQRKNITREQAGAKYQKSKQDKKYWLFELGKSQRVKSYVNVSGLRDFKFRLLGVEDLENSVEWSDLPDHYAFLQST